MSNNDIDRAFIELKALSQKKGYLLFDDLERGTDGLLLNEVDWLTNRLLTSGVEILEHPVPVPGKKQVLLAIDLLTF